MQVPNAVWLSIIAAVQMIVSSQFPDYWWSPVVIALCVALGKLWQVNSQTVATDADPQAAAARGADAPPAQDSKLKRWMVG
jgi:hypothetical protein